MNGSPAAGFPGHPTASVAASTSASSSASGSVAPGPIPAGTDPRPSWLTPDLVSALRPSFYPTSSFPAPTTSAAGAASSPFLHPHHSPAPGPLSSIHPPYHQIYGPLSAAANYHAAAAAISAGHRAPFLDPAAFLGPRYRYLLPSSSARFPLPAAAPSAAERSLSESEGLGPGRPAWRRPVSPPPHKPPAPAAPVRPPQPAPVDPNDAARFRVPSVSTAGPSLPTQPYYPSHFMRGTVIQLASGELKRVEELNTEDFVRSANMSSQLKMDSSTVVRVEEKTKDTVLLCFSVGENKVQDFVRSANMSSQLKMDSSTVVRVEEKTKDTVLLCFSVGENKVQVSVEATVEHPFFVIGQGWSSCSPERTRILYGLPCQRLQVGDICISLTHRDVGSACLSSSLRRLKSPKREAAPIVVPAVPVPTRPTPTLPASASVPSALKRPSSQPRRGASPPSTSHSAPKRARSWSASN